jgi:hypothetical protein
MKVSNVNVAMLSNDQPPVPSLLQGLARLRVTELLNCVARQDMRVMKIFLQGTAFAFARLR